MNKYPIIRKIYLYLFALIGLSLVVIGGVKLVSLGLKTYVFTKADIYYEYPAARPVKVAPVEGEKNAELQAPSKEEVEKFQENQRTSQRHRDAAESLAYIIVGAPLYFYHWRMIRKDKESELKD